MKHWFIGFILLILSGISTVTPLQSKLHVGVVDRLEGENVVILLEERKEELIVEKMDLAPYAKKGRWLLLLQVDTQYVIIKMLPFLEMKQKERSSALLQKLKEK